MKANELRIGNYVDWIVKEDVHFGIARVEGMFLDHGQWFIDNDLHHCIHIDKLKPIPLTEEWLVKFGFQSDNLLDEDRTPILTIDCGEHVIDFIVGYYDECEVDDLSTPCKHVHQLQNLYFALTGEELTIKE